MRLDEPTVRELLKACLNLELPDRELPFIAALQEKYPHLNVVEESEKMMLWYKDKNKRSIKKRLGFHNWMKKADRIYTSRPEFTEQAHRDRIAKEKKEELDASIRQSNEQRPDTVKKINALRKQLADQFTIR